MDTSQKILLPTSYIRWVQPAEDEIERGCEYDMDEQDLEWLQALNMDRKRLGQEPVTCELFEIVMDRLEKEWFQLNLRTQKPDVNITSTEDSRCAICEDGDTENSNAIVFCDGCNLAVHQDCYGVPYIPEGQWLCRKCTVSPDRPVTCELCPNSFGAFKQTSENKWAHLVCAIHIPETGVGNAMYMEPVDGVRSIPKQRWKLKCYICKKIAGACIQCANRSCCVAYHATCAQETGLYVKMKPPGSLYPTTGSRGTEEPPESSADHAGAEGIRISQSFCDKHTPKGHIEALQAAAEARLSTNPATTAESNLTTKSPDPQPSNPSFEIRSKKINSLEDLRALKLLATGSQTSKSARAYHKSYSSGPPLVPEVIFQRVMQYSSKIRCAYKKTVLSMICRYWSLKREVRRGAPLLKRLHLEPWTAAGVTASKNEEDRRRKYELLVAVRHDLQQVKNLTAMICKREKIKLRKAEIQKEVIEKTLFPVYQRMSLALTALIEADKQKYFLHPVSAAEVPDYYDIIKRPMNWSTIRRKIDRFEYFRLSEFISDVHLTLTNARIYNHASSAYHKAAIRIGKAIEPLLQDLIASEPPSAIAGLTSESFPTRGQKEHFKEVSLILLPDRIGDLSEAQNLLGSTPRSYEDVMRERNVKRSTQSQNTSLLNLLSTAAHCQDQTGCSTSPPSAKVEPPSLLRHEETVPNLDFQSVTKQTSYVISSSRKVENHRDEKPLHKKASGSSGAVRQLSSSTVPSQPTAQTVVISTTPIPPQDKGSMLGSSGAKNSENKKRGRTTTDSSDSAVGRPVKRATPRVKPQSQLEEEALIEKENPHATRGQLISLKLRAFHAKRIAERERNMPPEEKARRLKNREYIRLKRMKAAKAKLSQGEMDSSLEGTEQPSPSQSQTDHANQVSPNPDQVCATLNESENSLSREVSYPVSNDDQSHTNNYNQGPSKVLPQLWKVVDDESEQSHTDLPKEFRHRAPSKSIQEGTVSPSSPTRSGTQIQNSINCRSMQRDEDILSAIDEKFDEVLSLVSPADPMILGTTVDTAEHPASLATQGDLIQESENASRDAGVLSSPEDGAIKHAHAAEFEIHADTRELREKICDGVTDANIEEIERGCFAESADLQGYSPSFQPEAIVLNPEAIGSNTANQNTGDSSCSSGPPASNPDDELEQAEDRSEQLDAPQSEIAIDQHRMRLGEIALDEEMALEVSLLNAEHRDLPSPSSHLAIEHEAVERGHPLVSTSSLSLIAGGVEDTYPAVMATTSSPHLVTGTPGRGTEELGSIEFDNSGVAPIQIGQDEPTGLSPPPECGLVNHRSVSHTHLSPSPVDKSTPAQGDLAVGPLRRCHDMDPPTTKPSVVNSEKISNNAPLQSKQRLRIRIKKTDSSAAIGKNSTGEGVPSELIPVSASPKLRLILDGTPNWDAIREAGSSITPGPEGFREDVTRHGKEAYKSKTPKSTGYVGPPEFVTSLPGEKDSFRFFNTGFILPEGTRRHRAVSLSNVSDSKVRESSHPKTPEWRETTSPITKAHPTRVSARLKPMRLTLLHNSPTLQDTPAEASASNSILPGFSTNVPNRLSREPISPPADESESSELSKACSNSLEHTSSWEGDVTNPPDTQLHSEAPQKQSLVAGTVDDVALKTRRTVQKANKTSKTTKKSKPTRAEQERELDMDSRGFLIYPKASNNGAKRVHPLARDAFTRMSHATRLPEEGFIEDGTLVWAKVPGHPWFPAEVGLPEDPGVPQSMLDKKPTGEKMEHHVLVMFFDRHRSWQWVLRRNTRLLGESDALDALLSSEAYVSNKSQLEEIQRGCAFARSNIEQPNDAKAPQEEEIVDTSQQYDITRDKPDDIHTSCENGTTRLANTQQEACDRPLLETIEDTSAGLKRPRRRRLRSSNPSFP